MRPARLTALIATVLAAPALASGPGESHAEGDAFLAQARMTYALFERAVPHEDIAHCPAQFDEDAVFCRLTLTGGQAHVFVFAFADDQPLLAIKDYDLGGDFLPF